MTFARRVLSIAILGGLVASSADAGPLLFTFTGEIAVLQTLTRVDTFSSATGSTTVITPTIQFNVPISGAMRFDSDVWSLAAPVGGPVPTREFTVIDPAGASGTSGVDTPELIRGSLDVAGIGTLPFSRHLVDGLPATATPFPYEGTTRMGYLDGTEGLTAFDPPFEVGDSFFFNYSNVSGWQDFTTSAPGDVYAVVEASSVGLTLASGFAFPFVLQDLFPAGPPLAFTFIDPDPGSCVVCPDGLFSSATFSVFSQIGSYTDDGFELTTTTIAASSLSGSSAILVRRAELRAVPEPASLALLVFGAMGIGVARRRRLPRSIA